MSRGGIIEDIFELLSGNGDNNSYLESSSSRRINQTQVRNSQISATTESFLSRYEDTLSDMREQGIDQFVQSDFNELSSMLSEAQSILYSNPLRARDLSREIGSRISGLPRLARSLRHNSEHQERQRAHQRQEAEKREFVQRQNAIREEQKAFYENIQSAVKERFCDPVALDIAWDKVEELRTRYSNLALVADADIASIETRFSAELIELAESVAEQANAWREKKKREQQKENVAEQIAINAEVLQQKASEGTNAELKAVADKLSKLNDDYQKGLVPSEEIQASIVEAQEAATEIITGEELRKETLKAVVTLLKEIGFAFPTKPKLQNDGFVRLLARRPDGKECTFLVNATGGMKYAFDKYKGSACKKDISRVLPKLSEVYGLNLSKERVLWENPDEIGKEAKDFPDGNSIGGRG